MEGTMVGPFFYIKGKVCAKPIALESAKENVDGILDAELSHKALYSTIRTKMKLLEAIHPYEYWPRGRVVYDKSGDKPKVFLDACIKDKDGIRTKIAKAFGFDPQRAEWSLDGHYLCHRCNPDFVDID